jgi:hypothetical protein
VGARRGRHRRALPAHRGHAGIVDFATIVFGVQCVAASSILALGLTARRRRRRAAAAS